MLYKPFLSLLNSRKFLLALVGVVVIVLQDVTGLTPEVVASIEALLIAVIVGIAVEDAAAKFRQ